MTREHRPHVVGAIRNATRGCPAREDRTHTALSQAFRSGTIYAYSYDRDDKCWLTWPTEADWLATERNGKVRRPDLQALGHGPVAYEPPAVERRKLTKAQLVAQLAALDLPVEARRVLEMA